MKKKLSYKNSITNSITKEMKELFVFNTPSVHFTFNG